MIKPMHFPAIFTVALMPLVYMVTYRVLWGPFTPDVQALVIGSVLGSVLGSMTGYWLGTSASSARKDERSSSVEVTPAPAPP